MVKYNFEVVSIKYDDLEDIFNISFKDDNGNQSEISAKNLVYGVGGSPKVLYFVKKISNNRSNIFHSSNFLDSISKIEA